ncbi:MAG: hypothetical protein LOD88_11385, partial [Novibacillus thermophilus]
LPNSLITREKDEAEWLIVGFGSTRGPIEEAREQLAADGIPTSHLHIRVLAPFPTQSVKDVLSRYERVLVVENNATGQLAAQLRQYVGDISTIYSQTKFNGDPYYPSEITEHVKELMAHGNSQRLSYVR